MDELTTEPAMEKDTVVAVEPLASRVQNPGGGTTKGGKIEVEKEAVDVKVEGAPTTNVRGGAPRAAGTEDLLGPALPNFPREETKSQNNS